MERHKPYRAYLVRIWPTKRRGEEGHRATVEDVASGERKDFVGLESLFAFLETPDDDPSRRGLAAASNGFDSPSPAEDRSAGG